MATEQSAYDVLRNFFEQYGIQWDAEIENVIRQAMVDGFGPDKIDLIMPDIEKTRAFQTRFAGWAQRVKNGYNAVSIGDYLQLENQYHRILQQAGLPAGFYDDPSDFGNWIANDVSPDEVMGRVQLAVNAAQQLDPTMRTLLGQFYGLATGDLAAYFLDQKRALPVIERQFKAAQIATAASRAGLKVSSMGRYEDLLDRGLSPEQAASGYGTVRELSDMVGRAASVYGEEFNQDDAERDVFFNDSEKRRRIMSREAATFTGSSRGETGAAKRQSY